MEEVTSINCFCKSWLDLETVSKVSEMAHGPFVFIGYDSILQIHFLNKCMLKIKLIVFSRRNYWWIWCQVSSEKSFYTFPRRCTNHFGCPNSLHHSNWNHYNWNCYKTEKKEVNSYRCVRLWHYFHGKPVCQVLYSLPTVRFESAYHNFLEKRGFFQNNGSITGSSPKSKA